MEKFLVLVFFCLVGSSCAFKIPTEEDVREESLQEKGSPIKKDFLSEMIEDDDEPEAVDNTYRLLDAIVLDESIVMGGKVEWFYGKGEKESCKDGEKELEPKCKWRGLVVEDKDKIPQKVRLQVIKKYCKRANLKWPGVKKVKC